jgi:uncharacterized membrane protein
LLRAPATRCKNVGNGERIASSAAGLALIVNSLKRKSPISAGVSLLSGASLVYRGLSGYCGLYAALGIDRSQQHSQNLGVRANRGVKFESSVIINRPAADLYRHWRDLENIPQVLDHISAVILLDEKHSRWIAQGPFDQHIEWQAEILNERENELLAWRSLPGSDLDTAGSVRFAELPSERGTAVTLSLKYDPPGGKIGATLSALFGRNPDQDLQASLRRFKQRMEAGESPSVEGQPQGQCGTCTPDRKG